MPRSWSCRTTTSTRSSRSATAAATGSRRASSPTTARRIFQAWRELQVGAVVVGGTSNFRLDHVPFGGVKDSGIGRESPRWMIDDYTYVKTLLWKDESVWGSQPMTMHRLTTTEAAHVTTIPLQPSASRRAPTWSSASWRSWGVTNVFGLCGHTNIALLDAFGRSEHRVRRLPARADRRARRGRLRTRHRQAGRRRRARRPRHDERRHRRRDRRPRLGARSSSSAETSRPTTAAVTRTRR